MLLNHDQSVAAQFGQLEVMTALLDNGAIVDEKRDIGATPL
jgi:hypothetical protein